MDQKLRDLRTLKQHYYPEVNIGWSDYHHQGMLGWLAIHRDNHTQIKDQNQNQNRDNQV